RKTSPELFRKGFRWPVALAALAAVAHLALGRSLGYPAFITVDPLYPGWFSAMVAKAAGTYPFWTILLVVFNLVVVVQEFGRGVSARQKRGEEGVLTSLYHLVAKSRRRYGGYLVHVGIALMFIGFVGRGWSVDKEASMSKGDTVRFEQYAIT